MDIEPAQPDRICQPLIGIGNSRFAWLVVWLMLLLSTALPGRMVCGQATDSAQETSPKPTSAEVTSDGGSLEATESTGFDEPVSDAPTKATDTQPLRNRLISYAFFGGLTLVFLSVLFGYLRLDHATRGFHSGRLQLAALILLGIVLLVGYLLWTQVLFK